MQTPMSGAQSERMEPRVEDTKQQTKKKVKDPNRAQALLQSPDEKRSQFAITYADDERRMEYWVKKRGYKVLTRDYRPMGGLRRSQTAAYAAIRRQVEAEMKAEAAESKKEKASE